MNSTQLKAIRQDLTSKGRALKRALDQLIDGAQVEGVGDRRWRTYHLAPAINHLGPEGR